MRLQNQQPKRKTIIGGKVPCLSCLHRRSIFAHSFQVQRSNPFCSFPFRHIASSHLSTWSISAITSPHPHSQRGLARYAARTHLMCAYADTEQNSSTRPSGTFSSPRSTRRGHVNRWRSIDIPARFSASAIGYMMMLRRS